MLFYPKCNLHTHTNLCDGADSPEEIVMEAIRQGMHTVGFSGHSFTPFDAGYCMSPEKNDVYRAEISRLKTVYGDRIHVLCGLEQDMDSPDPAEGFDYVIGSVHYVFRDGVYHPVDHSEAAMRQSVQQAFGGDIYRYTKSYYESLAQVVKKTKCQIVGHFDLVEKFNQDERMFSVDDYRYRRPLIDALDELLRQDVIFEINTGAMSRGYRTTPYPSPYVLRRIAEKRGRVMINSDAHKKENLMFAFGDAVRYARSCGIGGFTVPTEHGWEIRPIGSKFD